MFAIRLNWKYPALSLMPSIYHWINCVSGYTNCRKIKEILVACQVGLRGHVAYRMLIQHGFKARNLTGGFKTYQMVTTKF